MKWIFISIAAIGIAGILASAMTGDGAFKKKFTVSGIVTVHIPERKTTCFVDSEAHGISCFPDWFIEGNFKK